MFEVGEASTCPVCGVALTSFDKLPPSHDAMHDEAGVPTAPELETLAWTDLRRGRGALTAVALSGLVAFFLPWVQMTLPYVASKSGFDLAHERIGWLWAPFAAWITLIPTVLSRRSIAKLRGARVAAAFLSAIPSVSTAILLARPPRGTIVRVIYEYDTALYATLALGLVAVVLSLRLGGHADDIRVKRGTSAGQVLH